MTPHDKFATTRKELAASMIERDEEIDLVLTALVAQEHALMVGDPGTGKSMLSDAIVSWMHGAKFSMQINKFTTPEEVFGPISVQGLKVDRYKRIIEGKLPTADVAFIDEIFKASSAILNTMLQVLNERTFRNDDTLVQCPLKLCVAASNEWPGEQEGGKELGALFDRFLFRKTVRPVATEKGRERLLWTPDLTPRLSTVITGAEIEQATAQAEALTWSDEAKSAFRSILKEAKQEGIRPGDRRVRKSVKAAQAYAWLQGETEVIPDSLEILGHILWDDYAEQPRKIAEIVGRNANPTGMRVNSLLMEADQLISSADLRDLMQAGTCTKKLAEIQKSLSAKDLVGPRADMARDYIKEQIKAIRLKTAEAM